MLLKEYHRYSSQSIHERDIESTTKTAPTQHTNLSPTTATTTVASKAIESTMKSDFHVIPLLFSRSYRNLIRQPDLFFSRFTQGIFYALILSCFYAPVGSDQNSVQNRIGLLYELTALTFIGMLNCIAIFPIERNVFYREYIDGCYSTQAFTISYFGIGIPLVALSAFCISLLVTYAIGLKPDLLATIAFSYVLFTFMYVGECFGVIFCAAFTHIGFSLNIVSAVISVFGKFPLSLLIHRHGNVVSLVTVIGMLAGFISVSMPQFLTDLSSISPMYWGAYIISNISFEDQTFDCNTDDALPDGSCLYSTGDDVLDLYNMTGADGKYGLTFHYIILTIVTIGYMLLAMFAMRLRAFKLSH